MNTFIKAILFSGFIAGSFYLVKHPQNSEQAKAVIHTSEHPGFFEEWFNRKKNEQGIIPMGMYNTWIKADDKNIRKAKRGFSPFSAIHELGPFTVGGRTRALMIDHSNDARIFAGAISGGLWLSENEGVTWNPVNEQMSSLAVSCITQNPFDPDIIYFGTGETRANSSGVPGEGVFKSVDGGLSFKQLPTSVFPGFQNIWTITHSKTDSMTVYVGVEGNGLYRTSDGGLSWVQLMTSVTITDIETFADGSVIATRSGNGIYKSDDGSPGSFVKQVTGLPASSAGRIEITSCFAFPKVIYALYEGNGSNPAILYKSSNGGINWSFRSTVSTGGSYFTYCILLGVHPADTNLVVTGGVVPRMSTNGGIGWVNLKNTHSDYHSFANFNLNKDYFLIGNDGGVYKHDWKDRLFSVDLNAGYRTIQFYGGNCFPDGLSGLAGTQDNGTHRILNQTHQKMYGGDGGVSHVSFQDPNLGYIETQNGAIRRSTNMSSSLPLFQLIDTGIFDTDYFISPFEMNLADGKQLYFLTTAGLWRTTNTGTSWTKMTNAGGLWAVHVENKPDPVVYFGGSSAVIYRLDNAATSLPQLEKNYSTQVPALVTDDYIGGISGNDDSTGLIFVSFTNYSNNPKIYKVRNAHTDSWEWINISGDLPVGVPVNMVHQDPYKPNYLYAATDFGLYFTDNGGINWTKETRIPNVSIHQMRYRKSDQMLFLFTHGRGMWCLKSDGPIVFNSLNRQTTPELNMYPNPSQGKTTLQNLPESNGIVKLFDMKGVLKFSVRATANQISLNLSHLQSGQYLVSWENENIRKTSRLILMNP